jgi:hypothetical protein
LRLSLKKVATRCIHRDEDEGMNPTLVKAIAALVPTGMLLVGSTLQFSRGKRIVALLQLIGAASLMVVVIAHVCEALGWLPWMQWGLEHSVGHYIDLVAAIGGLALFPIGYLFGALTREIA